MGDGGRKVECSRPFFATPSSKSAWAIYYPSRKVGVGRIREKGKTEVSGNEVIRVGPMPTKSLSL